MTPTHGHAVRWTSIGTWISANVSRRLSGVVTKATTAATSMLADATTASTAIPRRTRPRVTSSTPHEASTTNASAATKGASGNPLKVTPIVEL